MWVQVEFIAWGGPRTVVGIFPSLELARRQFRLVALKPDRDPDLLEGLDLKRAYSRATIRESCKTNGVVPPAGLEPATRGLGNRCSFL